MLAIGLIIIGILSRFMFHLPNFTPIIAIALFSGVYLKKQHAVFVPIGMMIIADFFVGFHALVLFTWGSMALIALIGLFVKNKKNWKNVAIASLGSSILFFIITNFGVWLFFDTYDIDGKNLNGLLVCYVAAIPYFQNTLLSTIIYTAVLFGCYELLVLKLKDTRLAWALK